MRTWYYTRTTSQTREHTVGSSSPNILFPTSTVCQSRILSLQLKSTRGK